MSDIITQTNIGNYEIYSGFPSHFVGTTMTYVVLNNKVMLAASVSSEVSFHKISFVKFNPHAYGGRGSYSEINATGKYTLKTVVDKYKSRDIIMSIPLTKKEASQIVPKQIIDFISKNKKIYVLKGR